MELSVNEKYNTTKIKYVSVLTCGVSFSMDNLMFRAEFLFIFKGGFFFWAVVFGISSYKVHEVFSKKNPALIMQNKSVFNI